MIINQSPVNFNGYLKGPKDSSETKVDVKMDRALWAPIGGFIKYQMPEAGIVNIDIFNSLGQKINTLVNCRQAAGYYTVLWDGKNNQGKQVASGIYFICFHINQFYDTKKVMLMK